MQKNTIKILRKPPKRTKYLTIIFRTGVIGIKVKIMLPHDPTGKIGPKNPLPDHVNVVEPKPEEPVTGPRSEAKNLPVEAPVAPAQPQQEVQQAQY